MRSFLCSRFFVVPGVTSRFVLVLKCRARLRSGIVGIFGNC